MLLPEYVNCNNQEFEHCDDIMNEDCPGTCAFYREIGGVGVGAPMIDPAALHKYENSNI